jgi:hypothetical protein
MLCAIRRGYLRRDQASAAFHGGSSIILGATKWPSLRIVQARRFRVGTTLPHGLAEVVKRRLQTFLVPSRAVEPTLQATYWHLRAPKVFSRPSAAPAKAIPTEGIAPKRWVDP